MSDNPMRILLIEDNPGDARLIQEMLNEAKSAPFILEWRDRLSSGLQKLAEDGADVILLDLGLSDSQGLDTYSKAQSQFPGVPIVVLSGLHDESVAVKAVSEGAQDYLVKGQIDGKLTARSMMYAIERKRSEMAIKKLRHQIELILNSAGEGIFGLDLNGNYTFVNPAAGKMLGYEAGYLSGKHSHSFIHHSKIDGSPYPEFESPICATYRDGSIHHAEELFWRMDGTSFPVEMTSTPIRENNEIVGAVVTFRDITERKRAVEQLRSAHDKLETRVAERTAELIKVNKALDAEIAERKLFEERQTHLIKELESINRELDDFAHIISHDLKAPLRAIKSLSDWVMQDHADAIGEYGKEKMVLLNSRIDHLRDLIDSILEYSRIGRLVKDVAEVDLSSLVDKVIASLLCPKNIRITVDNQLPVVTCDMVRIGQVFQNLVDNAVKHMDKHEGEIRIGCVGDGKQWTFSVADNGPGIERKHYKRIFQLFQSLHGDEKKGMGAGLAITKKIVEMHGGRIWVDSKVGRGSTFFFSLPGPAVSKGMDK
jgi:PAS domain S-box-containing protein